MVGPVAVITAMVVHVAKSVVSCTSYVSPGTDGQVKVRKFVPPELVTVTPTVIGTLEVNRPLVSTVVWMVNVTLLESLFGTPRYQVPLILVPNWFVRSTISSRFVPGFKLLPMNGGTNGNVLRSAVRSTLPLKLYNSKSAADGEFVIVKLKNVSSAAPGGKFVVNTSSLVSGMIVGLGGSTSTASMV